MSTFTKTDIPEGLGGIIKGADFVFDDNMIVNSMGALENLLTSPLNNYLTQTQNDLGGFKVQLVATVDWQHHSNQERHITTNHATTNAIITDVSQVTTEASNLFSALALF